MQSREMTTMAVSVSKPLLQNIRIASVVTHQVSMSVLVETALLHFFRLSESDQHIALNGQGKRRKAVSQPAPTSKTIAARASD